MSGDDEPQKPPKADARIGQVIGDKYLLRKVIARGASGTVYLADQMPLIRPVAVKVLELQATSETPDKLKARFLREAATLARLEHPNTVRIYDFGTWGERPFLVMEYVDGHSLRRLQGGGPIPIARALNIISQVCGALREAHALGLVHRDLKPANILLTRHAGVLDVVKVVDFGLAKGFYGLDAELTQVGQVLGTPMYMAPEQIRDEPCDPRADIYSLGVVMYRSVVGEAPFARNTTAELLMANLYDTPRPFLQVRPTLEVPPAVEWTVMRCLEKRPEDRFANVAELQRALQVCRRAVENPGYWHITPGFESGHTVVPDEMGEISTSISMVPHHHQPDRAPNPAPNVTGSITQPVPAQRAPTPPPALPPARPAAPAPIVAPVQPTPPVQVGQYVIPQWLLLAVILGVGAFGFLAGLLVDR